MEKKVSTDQNLLSDGEKTEFVDILSSCRLCMGRSDNMKHIFEEKQDNIIEKVEFCTGLLLTEENGLPSKICETCYHHLTMSHSFKTSCLLTEDTLRKILLTSVKNEKPESDLEIDDDDDFTWQDDVQDMLKGVLELHEADQKHENNSPELKKPKRIRGPYKKRKRDHPNTKKQKTTVKKKRIPKMSCDICNVTFETSKECSLHRRNQHEKPWICEICGKVFAIQATRYSHLRTHFPPNYQCDICDYKTWHKHDLVKHARIHTGEKNFQCEFCTASYRTSSNLTDHIRRVHKADEQGKHACQLCDKKFFDKTKLNRHIDSHNDVKRFECEECHSAFTRRCYWKKHLLQRHGIIIPPQRPGRQKTNVVHDPMEPGSIGHLASALEEA